MSHGIEVEAGTVEHDSVGAGGCHGPVPAFVGPLSVRLIAMIRFDGVSKKYPDGTVAVDDLSFEAPTGQITVLVGPSGCGKTTSLRMINRMIEPTDGTIWLDDQDTATVPPAQLRRGIGYVIQNAGLFPHRTILDNILTVPRLLGQDKSTSTARA